MKNVESGLLKEKKLIPCKYYELEQKCIEITYEFCSLSKENQNIFDEFSKPYYAFRPFFDFVVCHLGYKVLNPELEEKTILYGDSLHMYKHKIINESPTSFCYDLSDNKTLGIYPMKMDASTFHDCLIDWNGNHLIPQDMFGHVQILQQLLNLLLISNKEICLDYLDYESDLGVFVQRYLPIIRFQSDVQGRTVITRMTLREENTTDIQQNFINDLIANRYTYRSYIYNVSTLDKFSGAKGIQKELEFQKNSIDFSHKK